MFLVAGLGNPGEEYAASRHNIGFLVADRLAERWSVGSWKTKWGAAVAQGETKGQKVVLVKPMEYMNLSGPPVQRAAAFYQVPPASVIAIHDDIDLPFGKLRVKVGGGHGGHNGIRSMADTIGPAFIRVRCGVGHPGSKERVVGHVLGNFSKVEQKELPLLVDDAADAIEQVMKDGVSAAMNRWNADKKA